jgi:hypothetical protein
MKSLASFAVGFVIVFSPLRKKGQKTSIPMPDLKKGRAEHIWTPRALRRWPQSSTEPWHCCIISGTAAP